MKIKALIIGVLFGITVSANADPASMQEVFDQINARGNVTQPTAIQGQTMNYMTGGSLFMRTPNTTYNLAAITLLQLMLVVAALTCIWVASAL